MRRVLDVTLRWLACGGRTFVVLATVVALGAFAAMNLKGLAPTLIYDVAFMAAISAGVHNLHRWRSLEQTAWNLGEGGRTLVFLTATASEVAVLLLVAGGLARWTGLDLPASSLWGLLHLVAVALLLTRLPIRPAAAVYAFLALIWVVPALIPALQPMLDVRRWFHPGGFPGWIGAVSPILALVVGAFALPARALSSSGTNPA